jgi:ABC-2 type transport system permease protein
VQQRRHRHSLASNGAVSPFRDPRNADVVGRRLAIQHATLPATALAPLSIGQSDLLARHYPVSLEPRETLLANDGLTAPRLLQAGRFDLGFIVVVLGPLFVIALCHGVLTSERDRGCG